MRDHIKRNVVGKPATLIQQAAALIYKNLPVGYRVVLFGSWANGTASDRSDIDLAIDGPDPLDDTVLAVILGAVGSLPTLRKIDVVDIHRVGAGLRRQILTNGKPLSYDES